MRKSSLKICRKEKTLISELKSLKLLLLATSDVIENKLQEIEKLENKLEIKGGNNA